MVHYKVRKSFSNTWDYSFTTSVRSNRLSAAAHVEASDTGVVIANLVVKVLPGVKVQVLVEGATAKAGADEDMVEGLAVHVEQVGVALSGVKVDSLLEVDEAGLAQEGLHGLDLGELVEVTSGNNAGLGVKLHDLRNEVLEIES